MLYIKLNDYDILIDLEKRKAQLGRRRRKWEYNIKMTSRSRKYWRKLDTEVSDSVPIFCDHGTEILESSKSLWVTV